MQRRPVLVVRGRGNLGAHSALNFTGAAPSSSALLACPQHPGVPCVTSLGGFCLLRLPWCQRGEVTADSPELGSGGAHDSHPSSMPGNAGPWGWAGWVRACSGTGRPPGPLPPGTGMALSPGVALQGLSWGIPPCHASARAYSGFAQAGPLWGRYH